MQNGHADARSSRGSESPFKLDRRVDNAFYDRMSAHWSNRRVSRVKSRHGEAGESYMGDAKEGCGTKSSTGHPVWLGNLDSNQD